MFRFEKSIEIDAPVEQVFAYVVDPAHKPEYESGIAEVKDLQRLPDGRSTYTEVARFPGLQVEFTCEQVEVVPNERIVETGHGAGLDDITTERFERLADGKTRVTLLSENTLYAEPLATFGEESFAKSFEHSIEMAMQAAKARIQANVPSGATY